MYMMRIYGDRFLGKIKEIPDEISELLEEPFSFLIVSRKSIIKTERDALLKSVYDKNKKYELNIKVKLKPVEIVDEKYFVYKYFEKFNKPFANYLAFEFYGFSSEVLTEYLKEAHKFKFPIIAELKYF